VASNVDPHGHQKDHRNALHWALRGMSWMRNNWKKRGENRTSTEHLVENEILGISMNITGNALADSSDHRVNSIIHKSSKITRKAMIHWDPLGS